MLLSVYYATKNRDYCFEYALKFKLYVLINN